ncbi:Regulator of ribonuclease activity B [Pseudomonas cuatrocienegasensis]|uniref:Regulator of ribonuclease activity B n=1 Tax=Pseudomonas cuatrocienegasensis TaxID=543360 RepID=A0ABY1B892_9PSED|nr:MULTISPECIES: ribonuclease E inhibitor RraB [Pseudomonas]OEC35814.1 hypothetical protein A7D25_08325 [Pseudomonas sp. 21C1]SEQ20697.1 Regulator of ribonuclease activity B [Pseudomonas cuatrocienegasensis]
MTSTSTFISDQQHKENLELQLSMSPQTLEQLYEYGVSSSQSLKLEYFYYTNEQNKALSLSEPLVSLGYTSEFRQLEDAPGIYLITGWSTPVQATSDKINEWTAYMCSLGFKHDCEFDGWGTNPEQ